MYFWRNRYWFFLLILGIVLFCMGYQYALHSKNQSPILNHSSDLAVPFSPDVKLPSTIPNFRVASKRHAVLPVDLRRADLVLGDNDQEILPNVKPVLDKVLFVPKKFKRQS